MTQVTYWKIHEAKKGAKPKTEKVTYVCFACLNSDKDPTLRTIRYMCNVMKGLSKEDIKCYLDFLAEWLDGKLWKYKVLAGAPEDRYGKYDRRILFNLNVKGMNPTVRLLYLTALRYPDEYPELISAFAKRIKPKQSLEEKFAEFQQVNIDGERGKLKETVMGHNCYGGHSLMYAYYSKGIITLKEFYDNMKTAHSVNTMFSKKA